MTYLFLIIISGTSTLGLLRTIECSKCLVAVSLEYEVYAARRTFVCWRIEQGKSKDCIRRHTLGRTLFWTAVTVPLSCLVVYCLVQRLYFTAVRAVQQPALSRPVSTNPHANLQVSSRCWDYCPRCDARCPGMGSRWYVSLGLKHPCNILIIPL
jgi:hypothetical protein